MDERVVWPGKLNELVDLLTGELANDSVVVWFNFNDEIGAAQERLGKAGVSCETLTGEVNVARREDVRKRFTTGLTRVLLVQQAVAQTGMNLSKADTAIYFSEPCGLLASKQTEDRILDITRKSPLLYIYLLTAGTVDEDIHTALYHKNARSELTLRSALKEAFNDRLARQA